MTPDTVGPLSRPFVITRLPKEGTGVVVEATPAECAELAADFNLPAIHSLVGRLRVLPTRSGVRVTGRVEADIVQTCVVSLEEFGSKLDEEVEVSFEEADETGLRRGAAASDPDYEPPDEIVGGRIDLGAVVAEFLSLGLDPYPRKPGADFAGREDGATDSPFSGLAALRADNK